MNGEIMTIQGVECYEVEGTAYLKLETVARGLGFTQDKNGVEYVRWETVNSYLEDFGFPNKMGKDDFVPENVFYRLAMKARNETAERFQALIADEIIPAIRKHGAYIAPGTSPQGAEAAALQAVLQPISATMEALTAAVQTLTRRMDGLEQGGRMRALPPPLERNPFDGCPVPIKPPSNKMRRQWMRTASEKLSALADKCGIPSSSVLHALYRELEEDKGVILSEVRLKALEEHQLTDCSVLMAIFYDANLRRWFEGRVDQYLIHDTPSW